jgi:hypothetical protein
MGFVEPIAQLWIALAVNRLVERSSLVCSLIGRSSESDVASAGGLKRAMLGRWRIQFAQDSSVLMDFKASFVMLD